MAFKRRSRALLTAVGLLIAGGTTIFAMLNGFWGLLVTSLIIGLWLAAANSRFASVPPAFRVGAGTTAPTGLAANPLLLDAAPIPMIAIQQGRASALNRAARQLFGTDDRVLPAPKALLDPDCRHFRYDGRQWRIDRVLLEGGAARSSTVATLIDVEQEDRAAEARATAEVIHVVGHELLNGLAPILSLAESGMGALAQPHLDIDLMREILGTLARRTEGLQRFTEAYRTLARLPEPLLRPISVGQITEDLARLFKVRWPEVRLIVDAEVDRSISLDRDQISQAIWALLQNAAEAALSAQGPEFEVRLTVKDFRSKLVIDVTDNGSGVSPEMVNRVFQPFFSTKAKGTGVGLSIARQIIHVHGGSLTLKPESRTTFRIDLPCRETLA